MTVQNPRRRFQGRTAMAAAAKKRRRGNTGAVVSPIQRRRATLLVSVDGSPRWSMYRPPSAELMVNRKRQTSSSRSRSRAAERTDAEEGVVGGDFVSGEDGGSGRGASLKSSSERGAAASHAERGTSPLLPPLLADDGVADDSSRSRSSIPSSSPSTETKSSSTSPSPVANMNPSPLSPSDAVSYSPKPDDTRRRRPRLLPPPPFSNSISYSSIPFGKSNSNLPTFSVPMPSLDSHTHRLKAAHIRSNVNSDRARKTRRDGGCRRRAVRTARW
mmetsp:Transcript_52308/g.157000  ORF Transcript_52308/g.157000 Transcript_52308/m.157000 type:complete len:273 (-) Transcript_52308:323-1141(-)